MTLVTLVVRVELGPLVTPVNRAVLETLVRQEEWEEQEPQEAQDPQEEQVKRSNKTKYKYTIGKQLVQV